MKRWCWILISSILALAGGCAVSETDSAAAPQESLTLGESELGALQSCTRNDQCALGTACYNRTCIDLPSPPGPLPEEPWGERCVNDAQCAPFGRRCEVHTNTYVPNGPVGYCVAPSCSVSWSLSVIPPNATTNFIVTSSEMPWGGSYSVMYGTKNGVTDVDGAYYDWIEGVFPITNFPGFAGSYMRYLEMYAPDGRLFCTTNQAYADAL